MSVEQLRQFLQDLPPGPISEPEPLVEVLASCWREFAGSRDQGMAPWKLSRMEKPSWNPPHLTFKIERHGGLANGGTRAEVQRWALDLDRMAAHCEGGSYRQIRPRARPLNVRPLAQEIAGLILARSEDARLKWKDDRTVRILITETVPAGSDYGQTVKERRKRFRTVLSSLLERDGWRTVRPNVYEKVS